VDITAIILAAGEGKRMKSSFPKVLHKVANASFLEILLNTLSELRVKDIRIVASEDLQAHPNFQDLKDKFKFKVRIQKERLGTADALKYGIEPNEKNPILVLNGDTPLIEAETIRKVAHIVDDTDSDILCIGFKAKNPKGYGRLITFGEDLIEIIEEKDLKGNQVDIDLCNSGIYMLSPKHVSELLNKIGSENQAKEFYLTDIIKIAHDSGLKVSFLLTKENEAFGINDMKQKAYAEKIMQKKLRCKALEAGVTFASPDTTFLSYDTKFGTDVLIAQFVVIGPGVKIGDGVQIMSFSHIEGATIGENCKIGPYARIRPDTTIEKDCRVGNFVEVKATHIKSGSKASHLSYIGDASIGKNVNIGAGTIFCNFDGFSKHQSTIGDSTFIGSNVALVAPINVGNGAIIGAGSVVTEDVEDNSLAIARARQSNFRQKAGMIRKNKGA
jgi:bifunctional UDP-N-acetylglucosamine pyrophosphorylase/glucosamine-1-phosphate N-acetyltransferase